MSPALPSRSCQSRRSAYHAMRSKMRTKLVMASRMHKVYALDFYREYAQFVQCRSADEEVSIYIPHKEFSDPNNLPKLVTVTVEANS